MDNTLQFLNKDIIAAIVSKFYDEKSQRRDEQPALLTFENLFNRLSKEEIRLVHSLLTLNPYDYGFNGKFYGIFEVNKDLISISGQKYILDGNEITIPVQYTLSNVYDAFKYMRDKMQEEIGKSLLIESGFRSAASQTVVFIYYLNMNELDILRTAKRVAFPGYSEHGSLVKPAIDVLNLEGCPKDENPLEFENTKEFSWLVENADKFGFKLSYPKDNADGIMYEPWHWSFPIDS